MVRAPVEFLPEALDPEGGEWRIEDAAPIDSCVMLKEKVARVSKARTRAQEQIRFHELGHVWHTPPCEHETEMRQFICRMLEEFRVDLQLKLAGIDVRNRHDDFDLESVQVEASPYGRGMFWLQLRFQVSGATCADSVKKKFAEMAHGLPAPLRYLLDQAVQELTAEPTNEKREELAKRLFDYFAPPAPKATTMPGVMKPEVAKEINRQIQEEAEEAQKLIEAEKARAKKTQKPDQEHVKIEPLSEEEQDKLRRVGGLPTVGMAEIHDHLARNLKWEQVKAPFTRTGKGLTPEFMEHWLVDRRVYRTDHKGGVLVLDLSGSMRPNFPLIQQHMKEFPNLVVLSYFGLDKDGVNGRICVHSRAGRLDPCFQIEPGYSGGNDVDVEALLYGSKFRGPRIWVSDGQACGGAYAVKGPGLAGWGYGSSIAMKVREVMRQHHYIRVATLEAALKWVTMSGPIHYYNAGVLSSPAFRSKALRAGHPHWQDTPRGTEETPLPYCDSYGTESEHHRFGRRRS